MSKLRVLYVGNFFSSGAMTFQYCRDLAERLQRAGLRVFTMSARRARFLRLADMTVAAIRLRYDIALVDVFSGPSFIWAEAAVTAARLMRRPVVLILHGGGLPQFARANPRRARRLLRSAEEVVAPSRYLADALRPIRRSIHVIPNALDISRYPFRLRERPGPNILWLRAFQEAYAPVTAIEVLAALHDSGVSRAHLTMVGPDKGDGSLTRAKTRTEELGLMRKVTFLPGVPKEDVAKVLNNGDIYLNTTLVDNTPVTVIEAMACGLCIVSRKVGGIPYLIKDRETGLLVEGSSLGGFATEVRRIIQEPDLARRLSENARGVAETMDWSIVVPQWTKFLRNVAEGRRC